MRDILVVDDDADIRAALTEVLEEQGYVVRAAANGAEALKRVRERTPNLVLLDLMMPVMDGIEFLDVVKADRTMPEVPIVVLSANLAITQRHRRDVLCYLNKPVNLDLLLQTCELWCS